MRIRNQIFLLALSLCLSLRAFDVPVEVPDGYSKAVNGLCAKLTVSHAKVAKDGHVEVFIELRNMGAKDLQVEMDNPHDFRAELLDDKGRAIAPDLGRSDVLCSPKWVTVPARAYLGIPVSIEPDKGFHLDVTTDIWRLKPGKYQLRGHFSSKSFGVPNKKDPENAWSGEIELPAITFEITK